MREKLKEYWDNYSVILSSVDILDPRCKFKFIMKYF